VRPISALMVVRRPSGTRRANLRPPRVATPRRDLEDRRAIQAGWAHDLARPGQIPTGGRVSGMLTQATIHASRKSRLEMCGSQCQGVNVTAVGRRFPQTTSHVACQHHRQHAGSTRRGHDPAIVFDHDARSLAAGQTAIRLPGDHCRHGSTAARGLLGPQARAMELRVA
jgi:hypothetical protein